MPTTDMKKQWYDHRSRICDGCHFYRKAGERDTALGKVYFPEGCGNYGYSFNDKYPEPADDCEGFITTEQYKAAERAKELMKKKHNKK